MRKLYKKYFIPHEGNDHRPHLLRKPSVIVISYLIFTLFAGALLLSVYIRGTNFTATVLPDVLVDLANGDRAQNVLSGLTVSPTLVQAAQLKANDMAANSYFAHVSPAGVTPWHWFQQVGYSYRYAGENLAVDFFESGDVNSAWMNSPGHRANILNTHFTEIGIATAEGMYQGHPTTFVVQEFGQPLPKAATTVPTAEAAAPANSQEQIAPKLSPSQVLPKTSEGKPKPIAVVTPIATPKPVGEGGSAVESTTSNQTIVEDSQFIVVKNTDVIDETESSSPFQVSGGNLGGQVPKYSSWFERLLAKPSQDLQFAYLIIAILVLVALGHIVWGGLETHNYKQVVKGMLILILMATLLYIFRTSLFSQVIIR